MNLTALDWTILVACVAGLTWFSLRTARYMRGVADFLSANRSIGRYMLALDASVGGLGAISAISFFEQYYAAGFPPVFWMWMTIPAGMIVTLSGWVYYRFRETRCLTLAQFFEVRYSTRFRIFSGIIVWLSGALNFGIFPYVASNFFVYFIGLPDQVTVLGSTFPTFWPVMCVTTGLALLYTTVGGQITVAVTDCVQSMFVNVGLIVLIIFLLGRFDWPTVVETLHEAPVIEARENLQRDAELKKLAWEEAADQGLTEVAAERKEEVEALLAKAADETALREEAKGRSMINPFDTARVEHFGILFFLILVFNQFYGMLSWQGAQAYNSSSRSPHEQKMGQIIFWWLYGIRYAGLIILAVCALTFLHSPEFAAESAEAHQAVELLRSSDTPQLAVQQRVPIALAHILPTGLRGFFCVMMFFLLITTQDTYLHSWGSIFVQDVVVPIRKKPLEPRHHVTWLRCSIVGVAVFAILFGCFYKPTEFIQMYFAITGAVISGMGCAIVGGLYWKRGGTMAAYVAMSLGAVLSIGRIVLQQFTEQIAAVPEKGILLRFIHHTNTEVTSQIVWFWIMLTCIFSYVLISLLAVRKPFNMDRMLHRGEYDLEREHRTATDAVKRSWVKLVGITEEFTRNDRLMAIGILLYNLVWVAIFFGTAAWHFLVRPIPGEWWETFWFFWLRLNVVIGIPVVIWFVIGGVRDLRHVFRRLASLERDDRDDGRVVGHHLASEDDTVIAREDEHPPPP